MKRVLVFKSLRVLLLYLLIEEVNNTIFLTTNNIDENILKKLKNKIIIKEPQYSTNYFFRRIEYYKFIKSLKKNRNILELKKNKNNIFYGQDNILLGNVCLNDNFNLLEEGSLNYTFYNQSNYFIKKIIKKYIFGLNEIMGDSDYVKKIYLTGLAPTPKVIKDKVEIINLKELWDKKSMKEKEEILDIFDFNKDIIERIKIKKNILYTQPLSEDGFISEVEKIELYSKIIEKYEKDSLIIKVHPREKTDYKLYFCEIEVISKNFPAEIYQLLEIKFEKCITIFSTAALSLKEVEIDFYGTEIHTKLLKEFGSMDHIMKRNAFL